MQRFGTLSFGHYGPLGGEHILTAQDSMLQAIDLAQGMDDLGVNGAYFRVHHFARQQSSPMPLLAAIAARTQRIEVGTGVIDMRYENPLYLAEEAASVDLISEGRLALGVSRGSPETVVRGYEAFGYTGSADPRGADIAREHFDLFLRAVEGQGLAERDAMSPFGGGSGMQRSEPHSPGLRSRIWWGAGNRDSAEWAGRMGVNLMSSTLLTEDRGLPFDELQAQQIDAFREAWRGAGHAGEPRVSVSRSIFPITTAEDEMYFGGRQDGDGVGYIDGMRSTFGKTYAGAPDALVDQLLADAAVQSADTLMLTIPSQLGVAFAGFLKIIPPFIFMLPGILCFVLHPDLADPDEAFMTMVTNYLPVGMTGLIVAVLIAALVSTVDSGLNSFSTVFTLDIYVKGHRPNASPAEIKWVGRMAMVGVTILSILAALSMEGVGKSMFDLLQGIISFIAPPMGAVFLIGVLWRRATSRAAYATLVAGSIVSLSVGLMHFKHWPSAEFWPHYLLLAFYLFAGIVIFMVVVSLLTAKSQDEEDMPTLRETYAEMGASPRLVWILWGILAVIMMIIYVTLN